MTRSELVDKLVAFLWPMERGTDISHSTVEQVVGLKRESIEYRNVVSDAGARIEKAVERGGRGIRLYSVWGEGYRLLTTHEQLTEVSLREQGKLVKKMRREQRCIEAIPSTELSDHQRRLQAGQSASMDQTIKAMKTDLKERTLLCRPREQKPQIASA